MKKFFGAALFCAAVLLTLSACQRGGDQTSAAGAGGSVTGDSGMVEKMGEALPEGGEAPQSLSLANIVFYPEKKDPVVFNVEVATSPDERAKGLQGRQSLPDKSGMWFIFDRDVRDAFWMKDTAFALDLIFVDKDYKVVDIIANARPNSESLLVPQKDYRYVLELKGGAAAQIGLGVGGKLEYRLGPP